MSKNRFLSIFRNWKLLALAASGFCLLSVAAAQPPLYHQPDSTRKVLQLTGDYDGTWGMPTKSRTNTRAAMLATDLGSSFEHKGNLVFLFGDTWGGHNNFEDTIGISTSTNPWELEMQVPTAPDGKWRRILPPGLNTNVYCVPSHGISVNEIIYVVYTQPGANGDIMKRSFMISSSDDGATWQTLYQLDNSSDTTPRFVNVYMVERDGYVYMYGCGAYRASSPMLARAPIASFPQKTAWQYYTGSVGGQPQWSANVNLATTLFTHNQLGEFSCEWIETLDCWVLLYNSGEPRGITMRTAAQPWGPWSEGQVIMQPDGDQAYGNFMHVNWNQEKVDLFSDRGREYEWGGEYGPYLIPRFTRGTADRCELYYTMSTWNPYQVVLMRSTVGNLPFPATPMTVSQTLGHNMWRRYPANVANDFLHNDRPHITTYTVQDGDGSTGWLWQPLPMGATAASFRVHGGHGEIFLLENSDGLPASGDVGVVSQNLRNGMYGRVARRATGVRSNEPDVAWKWELTNLDAASLVLVIMDATTIGWGFISVSDVNVDVPVPPATVGDWMFY